MWRRGSTGWSGSLKLAERFGRGLARRLPVDGAMSTGTGKEAQESLKRLRHVDQLLRTPLEPGMQAWLRFERQVLLSSLQKNATPAPATAVI